MRSGERRCQARRSGARKPWGGRIAALGADTGLVAPRCRKWSRGRRAWRALSEVRSVDRRAPPSRRVQRKAVLRTPEPIENELFQIRRRPRVCWLVDQITHLGRILAVVVKAPAPGVGDRVGAPIRPDAAKQRGLLAALPTRFRLLYMHQERAFGGSHRISAHRVRKVHSLAVLGHRHTGEPAQRREEVDRTEENISRTVSWHHTWITEQERNPAGFIERQALAVISMRPEQ